MDTPTDGERGGRLNRRALLGAMGSAVVALIARPARALVKRTIIWIGHR